MTLRAAVFCRLIEIDRVRPPIEHDRLAGRRLGEADRLFELVGDVRGQAAGRVEDLNGRSRTAGRGAGQHQRRAENRQRGSKFAGQSSKSTLNASGTPAPVRGRA